MNVTKFRVLGLGSLLVAALATVGCDDKKEGEAPMPAASASASAAPHASAAPSASAAAGPTDAAAPADARSTGNEDDKLAAEEVVNHHRYHHGGIVRFIAMSLDTLGVAPERQAAVQKIQQELDTRQAPMHEAERALLAKLADGVAAGAVDDAKVEADLAQVSKDADRVRSASAELIKQLHATLAPVERAALVDKVQAHWQVWRDANTEEAAAAAAAPEKEEHGRLVRLTRDLSLTPDQVEKIRAGLKAKAGASGPVDPKLATDVDARLTAFTTSFSGESFDPKTLTAWEPVDSHLVATGATRMVRLCEVAAPILTPEQRTKFAAHLRDHRVEPAAGK